MISHDVVPTALQALECLDLTRAAQACRMWRTCAADESLWARLVTKDFPWARGEPTRARYASEWYCKMVIKFVDRGFKPFNTACYVFPGIPESGDPPTQFDPVAVAALVAAAPSPEAATHARVAYFRFQFCPPCHQHKTVWGIIEARSHCGTCFHKACWMARELLPLAGLSALIT